MSAAEHLSNEALPNKATPFSMFSLLFLTLSIFLRDTAITKRMEGQTDGRRDGCEIFPDAKARELCSSNQKNLAQT